MFARILSKPLKLNKSFFLLGPRGTGKTHWVNDHIPNAIYIDLLKTERYAELAAQPQRLRQMIPQDCQQWVVIDEVQRVPMLLNEVHALIESRGIKFVLTGSSARNLRKKGVNLLAGRALMFHMHPLTAAELGDKFDLAFSLRYGHLPAVFSEPDPKAYLSSYVNTYLREEVMQEGLTRQLSAFTRFLEVASFSQGSTINMSAIAREVGINQKLVSAYFDILDDLLIGVRIPVFSKRAKRKMVAHPKFYYFDVGVYQQLRPRGILDATAEIDGPGLETLFLEEYRALNDYYGLDYQLFYWRTQTGIEVDFIAYGENGFHAFEIKHKQRINRQDLKGLRALAQDYPQVKLYVFHGGSQTYYFDDVIALPFAQGLKRLPEILSKKA